MTDETRNPLEIATDLKARLDTISSDPKWLNDEVDTLIASLQDGAQVPVTVKITEQMSNDQVAAVNKMADAIKDAADKQHRLGMARLAQSNMLKKPAPPRDAASVAYILFARHMSQNMDADPGLVAEQCWNHAVAYLDVIKPLEMKREAALKAAREAAAAAAAAASGDGT